MSSPAKRPPGSRSPSPPAKRQPPPLDIAAIRAQLAAKKAALQTPPQGPPLPPLPPLPPSPPSTPMSQTGSQPPRPA
ncbi:hypothetical protein IAS59_001965 [Cryptococcus gattii]